MILDGIPKAGIHNGGRMTFGPDGFSTSPRGRRKPRRGTGSGHLGGKILRISAGRFARAGQPVRRPAGLLLRAPERAGPGVRAGRRPCAAEFGQNTWDELNVIEPGGNYGWPEVEGPDDSGEFVAPARVWPTDEASPSGIAVADGAVFMASLNGERLWRIPIDGTAPASRRPCFKDEYGRLRTVLLAPDGSLWLTTSNTDGRGDVRDGDDRILRVVVD